MASLTSNTISIIIAARDEASAVLKSTADNFASSGSKLASVGGSMIAVGENMSKYVTLPLVAAAAASVKMAGDFQASMTRLVTSAGESESNLKSVSAGVLQIANATGTSTTQLAQAMYMIESGGQHGAAGLEVLKAAAQGAKTENADLATVADAVTSAMTDYHLPASQAADVTSKLVAATGQGKTTFQDLAGAMSALLPKASAAGISLNEILGDLASMTLHGISAQQAAENMADAISHLQSPTQAMSKEMAALGLNSTQLSQSLGKTGLSGTIQEISKAIQSDMGPGSTAVILNMENALKGLPQSVQDVSQQVINGTATWTEWNKATKDLTVTQKAQAQAFATLYNGMHTIGTEQMSGAQVMQTYAGAMNKAMGDSSGLNVALMLTGENTKNTTTAIQAVTRATADASGNVKGWGDIQQTFNFHWAQFQAGLQTTAITIGTQLLPPVGAIVGFLANMLSGFDRLNPTVRTFVVVLAALAAAAGPVLIVIGAIATGLAAISPMAGAVIAVTALLGATLVANYSHISGAVKDATQAVDGWWNSLRQSTVVVILGQFLTQVFEPALRAVWAAIVQNLAPALDQLWTAVTRLWNALNPALGDALKLVGAILLGVFLAAIWAAVSVLNVIIQVFSMVVSAISNVINWLSNLIAWFGNLVGVASNTIRTVISVFRNLIPAVADVVGVVGSLFGSLAGTILHAVGNFGSLLYSAGRNLVDGLANGIRSAIDEVGSAVSDVGSSAVNKVKNLLGIHSPSTVFHEIGQNITQGMVNGINAGSDAVNNAMSGLAGGQAGSGGVRSATATNSPASPVAPSASGAPGAGGVTNILSGTFNFSNKDSVDAFFARLDKTQRLAAMGLAS
jgi:phage-related protein